MKKGLTELVFILDRSGSMGGLESDTIGGYNSTLDKQRSIEGDVTVTTVLFDNEYELLHDRADIRGVAPLTESDYFVRGSTALIDAIGLTISKIENAQKHTLEAMVCAGKERIFCHKAAEWCQGQHHSCLVSKKFGL